MVEGKGPVRGRDRSQLPRARARAGSRVPVRRRGVHEPDPGPSRLPQGHGGLLPAEGRSSPCASPAPPPSSMSTIPGASAWRPPRLPPVVDDLRTRGPARTSAQTQIRLRPGGRRLRPRPQGGAPFRLRSPLLGRFNVDNLLAAAAAGLALGLSGRGSRPACASVARVPGRLEPVEAGQPYPILVDYAHTPDALERLLLAVRELTDRKIILVFGCGGDRDRGKRFPMGEIAGRLADIPIATSDNPRSEDPTPSSRKSAPASRPPARRRRCGSRTAAKRFAPPSTSPTRARSSSSPEKATKPPRLSERRSCRSTTARSPPSLAAARR